MINKLFFTRTGQLRKAAAVIITVVVMAAFAIPAAASSLTLEDYYNMDPAIARMAVPRSGAGNLIHSLEYGLMVLGCKLIDNFDSAVTDLTQINLYSLIKRQFDIETNIYPIAWAAVSAGMIFTAIMLMIKADKIRLSDYFRSIFTSILMLIALPTLISSLADLRNKNIIDAMSSAFVEYKDLGSDTTFKTAETLGTKLLSSYIYEVGPSMQKNELCPMTDSAAYKRYSYYIYDLDINNTLDPEEYPYKYGSSTPGEIIQTPYRELDLEDKLKLLDKNFDLSTGDSIYNAYNSWQNRDDHYVERSGVDVYAKKGGGVKNKDEIWIRWGGGTLDPRIDGYSKSMFSYADCWVYNQIFQGETVYADSKYGVSDKQNRIVIPFMGDWTRIDDSNWRNFASSYDDATDDYRWGTYWQYHRYYVYNYERLIIQDIMALFVPDNAKYFPSEFSELFEYSFIADLYHTGSLNGAINLLESKKYKLSRLRTEMSILEYFNVAENYQKLIDKDVTTGKAAFSELESYEGITDIMSSAYFSSLIRNSGYADEELYEYQINFGYGFFLILVTLISLLFAGLKLANLLWDILFVQIVGPLIIATDLQGSGRSKQMVQNIISCNICFLIVVFDLKLYLRVVTIINSNMSFLPCVLLTLAGAKFVIDGPDLVVKIIGIDAGVKSGAATIMALRSGSQMFTDAGNKIRSIAHIPTKVAAAAGHVSAAVKDINSAEGPVNKIRAAAANTAPGQAFRSSEMQQDNVNENYASRRDNEFKGPGGTQMKRKDPAAPGSSPQSPSSGSSDGGSPQRSNDQQDHGRYGPSASYQFGAAYGRTVAAARNKIVDSANNLIDDVEQKGMVRAAADRAVSAAVKPVADTVHSLYQGAAEGYDSNKSRDKFGRRADAPSMGNTMTSVETSPQANNISAVSVSGSTENNNVTATANVQLSKNENNTNNTAANAIDQAAAMANETVNITEHHAASVSVTNTNNTANTFANTVNQSVNSGSVPGRVEVNGVNGINGNDGMNGKNGMDGPDAADAEQPPPTHFDFEVYSKPPETAEPPKKNDE